MNYEWKITNLVREYDADAGLTDVVTGAAFIVNGTDVDGVSSSYQGFTNFASPDPSSFEAFNSLSEEKVLGWVQTVLGGPSGIDAIHDQIIKKIARKREVAKSGLLPWAV